MPESVKGIWQILLAELDNFKKITVRAFFYTQFWLYY